MTQGAGGTGARSRGLLAQLDRALGLAEWGFIGSALAFTSVLLFANVVLHYVFLSPLN